jgi:hypothetical protein
MMAKSETMTIAFPHGGILPSEITGGAEQHVPAHEAVDVPRDYGAHLVSDRFAYEPKPAKKSKDDASAAAARVKLEAQLRGMREGADKETDPAKKAKLAGKIADVEKQLAALPPEASAD